MRRPESPVKQTPVKAPTRNSTLRASTASSANRTSKSQGTTAKKPKAATAEMPEEQRPRNVTANQAPPASILNVSKGDIVELKSLKTPHAAVKDVLSATAALLNIKDKSWPSLQKMMGSMHFL